MWPLFLSGNLVVLLWGLNVSIGHQLLLAFLADDRQKVKVSFMSDCCSRFNSRWLLWSQSCGLSPLRLELLVNLPELSLWSCRWSWRRQRSYVELFLRRDWVQKVLLTILHVIEIAVLLTRTFYHIVFTLMMGVFIDIDHWCGSILATHDIIGWAFFIVLDVRIVDVWLLAYNCCRFMQAGKEDGVLRVFQVLRLAHLRWSKLWIVVFVSDDYMIACHFQRLQCLHLACLIIHGHQRPYWGTCIQSCGILGSF